MAGKKASKRGAGKHPTGTSEGRRERLSYVRVMIANNVSYGDMARRIQDNYGVIDKTAYKDIKACYAELQGEMVKERPMHRHAMIRTLQAHFHRCCKAHQYAAATQCLVQQAKIMWLYEPEKHEHYHTGEVNLARDMKTDEQDRELERLLALRDELMGKGAANGSNGSGEMH